MKNSKLNKLVALASVLLVSVATLAGSTVAWFTDTEEVVNTIQSGDLDVELQYKVVESDGTLSTDWQEVEDNKQIFKENALYEPGYTEFVLLKVRNAGNLALQYKLSVDADNTVLGESVQQIKSAGTGDTIFLSDHLKLAAFPVELSNVASDAADFDTEVGTALGELSRSEIRAKIGDTVTDGTDGAEIPYISDGFENVARPAKEGYTTLTAEQADIAPAVIKSIVGATVSDIENIELWPKNVAEPGSDYDLYGLVLYMPEEVGNEANNRKVDGDGKIINPEIELGIRLEAAQVVEESDSFDNQYDLNATYDGNVYAAGSDDFAANVGGDGAAVNGYQPDSTPTVAPGGGDDDTTSGDVNTPPDGSTQASIMTFADLRYYIENASAQVADETTGKVNLGLGSDISFADVPADTTVYVTDNIYLHMYPYNFTDNTGNVTFSVAENANINFGGNDEKLGVMNFSGTGGSVDVLKSNAQSISASGKVTVNLTRVSFAENCGLTVNGDADVKIDNCSINGNMPASDTDYLVINGGTVTITNLPYGLNARTALNGGTLNIAAGYYYQAINVADGATLNISGGSYSGPFSAITAEGNAMVNITGGEFDQRYYSEGDGENKTFSLAECVNPQTHQITNDGSSWVISEITTGNV